jgi:hypothetical protein
VVAVLARQIALGVLTRTPSWARRWPVSACRRSRQLRARTNTLGAVLAGDPSIQSVDDLAQSRSRSLAVSSIARFESVETDALVWSLAYDR